jgi:hypothetical protein
MNVAAEQMGAVKTPVENRLYSPALAVNAALGTSGGFLRQSRFVLMKTEAKVAVRSQMKVKTGPCLFGGE